ncbi:molybdopterin oxidoreductase [Sphaerisporangium krabiense]|uniref:Anaerobic selenocysteine-containing dehydrogenase n=1 Tax=Sphaerisporangium krabiense TaxID=763782 RepID=A0A7W8ZBG3_9ACTN|nr:molybdopterin-dependent oxidoreductase [Sphaerisporangium krabiense]MBB5630961.1 anaerobic selenocysteine-containing dehydrogenase [Sphaerisporangium krabiense]GII65843.1 molybdopterin oxidoreductase [Sphaerisporangium krabiense]
MDTEWRPTACVLCASNCGIEVRLDGRRFERVRGDRAHPSSQGYTCEKPLRLDHYQNAADRLTHPLRRRPDGTFERITWDVAIAEVAAALSRVRDAHGGETIFYYGGGGQGNHLGGSYAGALMRALGARYRSNALAQEKTGLYWVSDRMLGTMVTGDFEHCEVALFIGKNPWQSHGVPRTRPTLREIARDPRRCLIVIDPRRTETAELADIHLRPRPGADAWLLAALAAVLVQEDLIARDWLAAHATGLEEVRAALRHVPVAGYCATAGVPEEQVRRAARRIAAAAGVAVFEDLGVQMNRHSTLNSYLDNLLWLLTGNFGRPGANNPPILFAPFISFSHHGPKRDRVSPVAGARIISGLVPANVIADEILTDHPRRYRAMLVESANPAHSIADSPRTREALAALDLLVVVDVAMTETARLAHYVLPAPSQFEKWEATFFTLETPVNQFHLRRPVLDPPPGADLLPEPEIYARLCEAIGALPEERVRPLREAAGRGRREFARAFLAAVEDPGQAAVAAVLLYRALGPTLPGGAAAAASLWAHAVRVARAHPEAVRRAGIDGEGVDLGDRLFDAILAAPSGLVFAVDAPGDAWRRLGTPDKKVHLALPDLLEELAGLATGPEASPDYPFVLSAGERRSFTANTIIRDPAWRRRDPHGTLRISPQDAEELGLADGSRARVTTRRGSAEATVEITETLLPGHISLPNGLGLAYPGEPGEVTTGAAPNELTSARDRDPYAGTPWHKHVPARVEAVA